MVVFASPRFLTLYYSRNFKKLGGTALITSCNTTGFNLLAPCHTAPPGQIHALRGLRNLIVKGWELQVLKQWSKYQTGSEHLSCWEFSSFSWPKGPADAGSGSRPQVSDRASPAQTPVLPVTSSCADWEQVTIPRQRKSKPQNERSLSDVCWLR